MLGISQVKHHCMTRRRPNLLHPSVKLLTTYSDFARAITSGKLESLTPRTTIDLQSKWPRTVNNLLRILHNQEVDLEGDIIGDEESMLVEMDTDQPLSVFEKAVDLLALGEYMMITSTDITKVIYDELHKYYSRHQTPWTTPFPVHALRTLFRLSPHVTDIKPIWRLIGKVLAPANAAWRYARVLPRRFKQYNSYTFPHHEALSWNLPLGKYVEEYSNKLLANAYPAGVWWEDKWYSNCLLTTRNLLLFEDSTEFSRSGPHPVPWLIITFTSIPMLRVTS